MSGAFRFRVNNIFLYRKKTNKGGSIMDKINEFLKKNYHGHKTRGLYSVGEIPDVTMDSVSRYKLMILLTVHHVRTKRGRIVK